MFHVVQDPLPLAMSNTKVIYTSLTKGYDNLLQPEVVRPDYDYICFSNDLGESDIGVWKIRKIPFSSSSGTRLTRYPKLNPHLVLPEYEYSVWIDANFKILGTAIYEKTDELIAGGSVCAMIPHENRSCVYQEAKMLTKWLIGEPDLVYRQTKFLIQERSLMFRKHNSPEIVAFSKLWWKTYCAYSCRDQMSVGYALFKTGLRPEAWFSRAFIDANKNAHQAQRRISLPLRIVRFAYWNALLARLRVLYAAKGIKWNGS